MQHIETTDGRVRRRWTVEDVVDFEHLVQRTPPEVDDAARALRASHPSPDDRRAVLLAWVDHARATTAATLPGAIYTRGRRSVSWLAAAAGCVTGASWCGALLARHEDEPINALMFLGLTVGVQLAVLVSATALALLRTRVASSGLRAALLWLTGWSGRLLARVDGTRRAALRARWAAIDFRSDRLAPLVGLELLIVTQVFAIAFNVGLLAALLLVHLPFEELRFGWQSTYSFTNEGVAAATRLFAAPWHWLSDALVPDAAQVAASRYTRGQRAESLPADAGHAWWPFLVASIAFYGLTLRVLLALAIKGSLRRRLVALRFDHAAANALWRRLQGPLVVADPAGGSLSDALAAPRANAGHPTDLLIVDRELAVDDTVRPRVEAAMRGPVRTMLVADIDDDAMDAALEAALSAAPSRLVVATSADRDPIVAIADFLRRLRTRAPSGADLVVVLVATSPASLAARDAIWRRFVAIERLDAGIEAAA